MAGLRARAADLALWLHLRQKAGPAAQPAPLSGLSPPKGDGPLLLIHVPPGDEDPPALGPVLAGLTAARGDLRLVISGGPRTPPQGGDAITDLPALETQPEVTAALGALDPAAVLILGDDLPAALIAGAARAGTPVVLMGARLNAATRGVWRNAVLRGLLARVTRILAPDRTAADLMARLGAPPARIETVGAVTDTRPPLRSNEAERRVMAQMLSGRHIWLAASPSLPEALAALAAHHDALHYNHRALLILAGIAPDALDEIRSAAENLGMALVLRTDDHDPRPDDQILLAEEDDEMGLWFRLAPVTFMGGTLFEGPALPPRHPFEPASLGSAIIHGPLGGAHAAEWAQLDGAHAARLVADAEALKGAVSDLSSAEQAAELARAAWDVSTGGAAVLRRIVAEVLAVIGPRR